MKNRIILFVLAICITTASLYGQQTSSASHLPVMDLNNPIVSAMPSNVDVTNRYETVFNAGRTSVLNVIRDPFLRYFPWYLIYMK